MAELLNLAGAAEILGRSPQFVRDRFLELGGRRYRLPGCKYWRYEFRRSRIERIAGKPIVEGTLKA